GPIGSLGGLFRVPAAAAEGLPAFTDCAQLRRWYVEQALPQVGPWGLGGAPMTFATERGAVTPQASAADSTDAVGSSETGTNVQEAGVDEADVAKTDGRLVVQTRAGRLVVTDVSGTRPRELSSTTLPGGVGPDPDLLLAGDRVLLVGGEVRSLLRGGIAEDRSYTWPLPDPHTRLVSYDIADPAHPRVTSDQSVDGGAVSTRQYADGVVRVVLTNQAPALRFVQPGDGRTPARATAENREIVRSAPLSAWLPRIHDDAGDGRPLLGCGEVRHPQAPSGFGTISVLTFGIDDPASLHATGVVASGDLVYSSTDRLYVATVRSGWRERVPEQGSPFGTRPRFAPTPASTQVHAFALDGDRTTYVASGSVPGAVKDRWSFSEHDGYLRVATGLGAVWNATQNAVVVLAEDGSRLREVGRVDGLGPDEQIQSVRWFGDLAVVVTFRQTDPLYTVDLSDPAHPRVVGALKIPGFSAYLHPVGDDRLVGVGQSGTQDGATLDAQVSCFDLRDLAHLSRTDALSLGAMTGTGVGVDPHTFTYVPDQRVLVVLVSDWTSGSQRFVAVHVGADGSLTETGSWVTRHWSDRVRPLPLGAGRVALVGDVVRLVDVG
ncbi:MAG: hypothetical protein HOQ45_07935, partial [Nocardioidaceae bacterium]|nr:hypothetical protein [Nocardioidaceae bacterium]